MPVLIRTELRSKDLLLRPGAEGVLVIRSAADGGVDAGLPDGGFRLHRQFVQPVCVFVSIPDGAPDPIAESLHRSRVQIPNNLRGARRVNAQARVGG